MIHIMLADDHTLFREGLKQIFSGTPDIVVVDEARTGDEAYRKILSNNVDVVLLDITLPDRNGLDVLKDIKSKKPNIQVLILSMHAEEQYAIQAFRAGASGYLTKNEAPENLLAAIRKVAMGGKYVSTSAAEKLVSQLADTDQAPPHHKLSGREFQVMQMIGSGKTVTQIAAELNLGISTISTVRARILKKMKMKSNAEISHYVLKEGLVD